MGKRAGKFTRGTEVNYCGKPYMVISNKDKYRLQSLRDSKLFISTKLDSFHLKEITKEEEDID